MRRNKQIDYPLATAIMLVTFWTGRDFCIFSDCRNSFNNNLKNFLKTSKKNAGLIANTVFI